MTESGETDTKNRCQETILEQDTTRGKNRENYLVKPLAPDLSVSPS